MGTYLPLEQANHTTALFQQAQLCMGMPLSGKAMAHVKGDTGRYAGVLTFALAS